MRAYLVVGKYAEARRELEPLPREAAQRSRSMIENLILQDINQGLGVGLLDPHGDLTNAILAKMSKRLDDVILLDLADYNFPFGFNLFTCTDPTDLEIVSQASNKVMHIFKKLWGKGGIVVEDAWGVLLEEILRAATMTFLEYSQYEVYTMAEIPLLWGLRRLSGSQGSNEVPFAATGRPSRTSSNTYPRRAQPPGPSSARPPPGTT